MDNHAGKKEFKILKSKKYIIVLLSLVIIGITSIVILLSTQNHENNDIFLTDEEKTWLDEHKDQIKIGYTTDYPPVEYLENGQYTGISADYFNLLEKKLGIDIQMVQFDNFDDLMKEALKRELTGITAATKTPQRSQFFDFTVPYIDNPNVIITRKNFSEKLTFEKLSNSSMDILVVEGFDIIEFLNKEFPKLEYRTVKSPSEGIRMVAFGEADAMIVEIMSATAAIERDKISNIVINVETPYESSLSIAVRNDWPILYQIFNKGLAQITKQEKKEIEQRWMGLQGKSMFHSTYFWIGFLTFVLFLLVIIIVILAWNAFLKSAVEEKTREIEKSKKELMHKTYRDKLTGLYNRTYMAEILEKLRTKDNLPFSILLADLNSLKITNDIFGHEVGDHMLIMVSELIRENIKDNHIACRIGGDEIVVLMPSTTEEEAVSIVENIQKASLDAEEDPIKPLVALGCATTYEDDNNGFSKLFNLAEDRMYANKITNSERDYDLMINSIKNNLYKNPYESRDHYDRLVTMCRQMGEFLNLEKKEIDRLILLAEYHDIGKAGLITELFKKEGSLTSDEWHRTKRHPELGFKIVSASAKLSHIRKGIFAHHERWDGSGYPQGLKGEEIPFTARLFSIIEAYDVMTHKRSYKQTYTKEQAVQELIDNAGTQFDPALVQAFVDFIGSSEYAHGGCS